MQVIKPGTVLGQFKIESRLGAGGMGAVFKALDTTLDREVALKVLDPRFCDNQEGIARFQREARTIASLRHPNLMHIYAVGESEGVQYFAMEYIRGTPLNGILTQNGGKIKLSRALRITVEVMAGLQKVHSQGIIHRDLKPANVMIDADDGRAILVDFGLSKDFAEEGLTSDGSILGTPDYMSPEQIEGHDLGPYTDIYSLGVMLYEMLSGTRPFTRKTTMQTLRAHCEYTPPSLDKTVEGVTPGLSAIIQKMLAPKPAERFNSIEEVAKALSAICRHPLLSRLIGKEQSQEKTIIEKSSPHYKQSVSLIADKQKMSGKPLTINHKATANPVSGKYVSLQPHKRPYIKYIIVALIVALLVIAVDYGFLHRMNIHTPDEITSQENKTEKLPEPAPKDDTTTVPTVSDKAPAASEISSLPLPVVTYTPKGKPVPREGVDNPSVILILRNQERVNGFITSLTDNTVKMLLFPKGSAEYKLSEIRSIISLESKGIEGILPETEGLLRNRLNNLRRNGIRREKLR